LDEIDSVQAELFEWPLTEEPADLRATRAAHLYEHLAATVERYDEEASNCISQWADAFERQKEELVNAGHQLTDEQKNVWQRMRDQTLSNESKAAGTGRHQIRLAAKRFEPTDIHRQKPVFSNAVQSGWDPVLAKLEHEVAQAESEALGERYLHPAYTFGSLVEEIRHNQAARGVTMVTDLGSDLPERQESDGESSTTLTGEIVEEKADSTAQDIVHRMGEVALQSTESREHVETRGESEPSVEQRSDKGDQRITVLPGEMQQHKADEEAPDQAEAVEGEGEPKSNEEDEGGMADDTDASKGPEGEPPIGDSENPNLRAAEDSSAADEESTETAATTDEEQGSVADVRVYPFNWTDVGSNIKPTHPGLEMIQFGEFSSQESFGTRDVPWGSDGTNDSTHLASQGRDSRS